MFAGKTVAWVLDYGGHGLRFGSANWDWPEAIEFDRRENCAFQRTNSPRRLFPADTIQNVKCDRIILWI
jgi:hypothetical protein